MAEENQNLVPVEGEATLGPRISRTLSCSKGNLVTALSVFVGLLVVGQAATVYFLTQQQSKITDLQATATQLKLNDMIRKQPGSPPSQNRQKIRMATFNIPLAFKDTDGSSENLEEIAKKSNKAEDAVKYMLLRGNPLRTYPSLNGTILDNLRKLRKTLSDQEWMIFDAWMQQWYLFYLVQPSQTPEPAKAPSGAVSTGANELLTTHAREHRPAALAPWETLVRDATSYSTDSFPGPLGETPSGEPVRTPCQEEASVLHMPGAFVPQCDDSGGYESVQCWRSTGYCWCVFKNGTEVPETRTRAKLDCSGILEPPFEDYDEFVEK